MAIAWNAAQMATGIPAIDAEHRTIIGKLNELLDAMQHGQGTAKVRVTLDFLEDYARRHFAHEEACMARVMCPAGAANKQAHAQFMTVVRGLRADFERSGPTPVLVLAMQREIGEWMRNHIIRTDTQLRGCVLQDA